MAGVKVLVAVLQVARQLRIVSSASFQEPDLPSFVSITVDKHANVRF